MATARPANTQATAMRGLRQVRQSAPGRVVSPTDRKRKVFTPKAAYSQKVWMATWLWGRASRRSVAPTVSPAVTAAMAPETCSCSAPTKAAKARAVVAMISASGSSVRRMTKLPTSPSASPTASPPTVARTTLAASRGIATGPPATTTRRWPRRPRARCRR